MARDARLQAIHLGNFRCGPDSFISHYVREEIKGKPYLQLEVDEHSADAGIVTRCEAFFDSLRGRPAAGSRAGRADCRATQRARASPPDARPQDRTLYFPYMADGAYALAAACRAAG